MSPIKTIRDVAKDSLYWALCPDYQLGPVAPVAIPFLIEVLEYDETPDKKNVLHLLLDCCLRLETSPEEMEIPHNQLQVETVQQINKALEVYIQLLKHPEWNTRLTAILLLIESGFPRSERQRLKTIYEEYKTQEQHPEIRRYFERWDRYFASVDSSSDAESDS